MARKSLTMLGITASLALVLALAPARAQAAVPLQGTPLNTHVAPTSYYAAPVRTPSGRVDIVATLRGVRAHGARSYQFLVANKWGYHSAQDWADLPAFLDAARHWSVRVEVILLPPTEASRPRAGHWEGDCSSGAYPPFYGRYDRWFTALGHLALRHPALVGSGMDDFRLNVASYCKAFKATSPVRWKALQSRAAHRTMLFVPTLYYGALVARSPDLVRLGKLQDVVYPFTAVGKPASMRTEYAAIKRRYPRLRVTIMIYARTTLNNHLAHIKAPTAATVDAEVRAARALKPAGVVVYLQFVGSS